MGISTAFIPFFDAVNSYVKISDPFLSLGSLQVNDEPELVENFCRENNYTPFNVGDSIYSLLHQRYGISAYESSDSIKKYIMMGIAYQKKNDNAFVIPNGLCA